MKHALARIYKDLYQSNLSPYSLIITSMEQVIILSSLQYLIYQL